MASQTPDPTKAPPEGIGFEIERVSLAESGQVEVSGRWFGVRGRRFMRPTLTLTLRSDGTERRALADLEHKPWAAQDGELWLASFPLAVELEDAAQMELSVAPDIAVELKQAPGTARKRGAQRPAAPGARAPRVRNDRVPARPSGADHAQELERLKERLVTAERATERERERRKAADRALEDERSRALGLRSELGQLRAQLDLAATTQEELAKVTSELDATRSEVRDTARRSQAATRALDEQRLESEHLSKQLAAAEATMQRLARSEATERRHLHAETGTRRAPPADPTAPTHMPAETAAPSPSPADATLRSPVIKPDPHFVRTDRPLNPALRSRPNLLGRALALIAVIAVIAAIVLVIHSTIA